jgi:hypothetical protein
VLVYQFSLSCSVFSLSYSVFSLSCSVFSLNYLVFSLSYSVFSLSYSVFSLSCSVFNQRPTECHLSSHTILRSVIYPTSFVSTGQPYKNSQNCAKSSTNHPSWPSGNPKVWKTSWWDLTSPLDLSTMVSVKIWWPSVCRKNHVGPSVWDVCWVEGQVCNLHRFCGYSSVY